MFVLEALARSARSAEHYRTTIDSWLVLGRLSDSVATAVWGRAAVMWSLIFFFFFQAEDGIRDKLVTGVQTCALPIYSLEERRLRLRRRTVDLVGQQDVREDRPMLELEMLPAVRVLDDDVGPDDVRRHQVGRELDAGEGELEPFGKGLDEERLAQARHALEKDVAARKHTDQDMRDHIVVADDHLLDFRAQGLEGGDERFNSSVAIHRALLSRIRPNRLSRFVPAIIESRQAPGAVACERPLVLILLDYYSMT